MADEFLHEEWRPVEGWPYEVSSLGRVRRSAAPNGRARIGRVLRPIRNRNGYLYVTLSARPEQKNKRTLLHRMVCAAFHGPAPTPDHETAHWDGDRGNCRATNLRWATKVENAADTIRMGRSQRGSLHYRNKLTNEDVMVIRAINPKTIKAWEATGTMFSVSPWTIRDVVEAKTWAWLRLSN